MITNLNDRIVAELTKANLPLEGWNTMKEIWTALKEHAKNGKAAKETAHTLVDKGVTVQRLIEERNAVTLEIKNITTANKDTNKENKKLDKRIAYKKESIKKLQAEVKELQAQKKTNRETVKERNIDANLLRVKKSRITACEKEMKSIIDEIFG